MKSPLLKKLGLAIVTFLPWLASMYLLYFLESQAIWVPETQHRDVMTVCILLSGMTSSFLLYGWLNKKGKA